MASGAASGDNVRPILGDIAPSKIVDIPALRPTLAEIEEAAAWAHGNDDVLAKTPAVHRPD